MIFGAPAVDPHPLRPGQEPAALRPTLGASRSGGAGAVAEQGYMLTGRKRRNMAASRKGILAISKEAEAILKSGPSYEKMARATVEEYARLLKGLDELTSRSTLTEADAVRLGQEIRRAAYRRIINARGIKRSAPDARDLSGALPGAVR